MIVMQDTYNVNLYVFYFWQAHRETNRVLVASEVQLAQTNFHFRRTEFSSQIKSKVDNILAKVASLRINLDIIGTRITSRSHTGLPIPFWIVYHVLS